MLADEFTISDVKYRANTMNAMTQFHVSRRLSPLMSVLPGIVKNRKPGDVATPIPPEQVKGALSDVLRIVGEMKDEDVDYVLDACLSRAQRWSEAQSSWHDVWSPEARRPMFDDINMIVMIMICFHVMRISLGPFTFGKSLSLTT